MWKRIIVGVAMATIVIDAAVMIVTHPDAVSIGMGSVGYVPEPLRADLAVPGVDFSAVTGLELPAVDGVDGSGDQRQTSSPVLETIPQIDPATGLIVAEPIASISASPPAPEAPGAGGGSNTDDPAPPPSDSPDPPAGESPDPPPTDGGQPSVPDPGQNPPPDKPTGPTGGDTTGPGTPPDQDPPPDDPPVVDPPVDPPPVTGPTGPLGGTGGTGGTGPTP